MRLQLAEASLLLVLAYAGAPSSAYAGQQSDIRGKLIIENGRPSLQESDGDKVRIQSTDDSIADTLADTRLSGQELKLVGRSGQDGVFQVEDLYVVHGSTLYRLIYYCDTCHITTFRPGNCECCQQPTVPTEVPLTDSRVHRENVKRLPQK